MLYINADIVKEIYNSKRLSNEMYQYLCSVIEREIHKPNYNLINDTLVRRCVEELVKIQQNE